MLSGLKFIPRDQLNTKNEVLDSDRKEKKKSGGRKEKRKIGKKKYDTSTSDDEEVEKISKGSRKNKKWYSSDEYSSPYESESNSDFVSDEKKHRRRRKEKKTCHEISEDEEHISNKRSKRSRKHRSSEEYSDSDSKSEDDDTFSGRKSKSHKGRVKHESHTTKRRQGEKDMEREDSSDSDRGSPSLDNKEIARKDAGLEWMLKPVMKIDRQSRQTESKIEEPQVEEVKKPNPKELNPYLKDNGSGYPQDAGEIKVGGDQILPSSVVGDGGASWRMKALKRAKEQAAREGRKFEEVVEERWESLGHLTVSVASSAAAPSHAHLHAIRDRKRGITEKHEIAEDDLNKRDAEKVPGDTNQERVPGDTRKYLRDVSLRNPEMKAPKFHNDLYWRKKRTENMSAEGAELISAAASNLNKFANNGNFMCEFTRQQNKDADGSVSSSEAKNSGEDVPVVKEVLSANQLAAKALQLRMKGKHEEADKLLQEAEKIKVKQDNKDKFVSQGTEGSVSRYIMKKDISAHKKKKEENADFHLAQHIMQNKQYSMSGQADDEYDYDGCPSKKRDKRRADVHKHKSSENANIAKRILTQQERCQFCFENPTRPKHLVISIANFTYLMLPQWQPIVQGHCCILPMLHESATRNVDNNVWEEIRNFKKCLIMMFAKQEKDVVFLETVIGLVQQRRHCLVECIPLPREIAKQAPLYFKKAIDEAEDEWSQHNAKKLIDTSEKGLRGSIPKDFPYFHVEFGLNKGFVHVIDDEKQFKSSFGLNVIRGMLRLPEEDMHRRRKHESLEVQRQAVASFARNWEPFDWTKQLD